MAVGLSLEAKREVLAQFIPVYRDAVGTQKRVVLDDVVRLTGYHRTYASCLLNQPTPVLQPAVRPRQRHYGVEVEEVLVQVWNVANRVANCLSPLCQCFSTRWNGMSIFTSLRSVEPACSR